MLSRNRWSDPHRPGQECGPAHNRKADDDSGVGDEAELMFLRGRETANRGAGHEWSHRSVGTRCKMTAGDVLQPQGERTNLRANRIKSSARVPGWYDEGRDPDTSAEDDANANRRVRLPITQADGSTTQEGTQKHSMGSKKKTARRKRPEKSPLVKFSAGRNQEHHALPADGAHGVLLAPGRLAEPKPCIHSDTHCPLRLTHLVGLNTLDVGHRHGCALSVAPR